MKKRLLCPQLPKNGTDSILADSEAIHAIRVLRLRDGEVVEAMDGTGHKAFATLRYRGGKPRLEYICPSQSTPKQPGQDRSSENTQELTIPLILEMAVLKGDAMEWVVEKAVELGVQELVPVLTDHTVVQMKNKTPEFFTERWQKIADQALKQCGRLTRMKVRLPIVLDNLLAQSTKSVRVWADEASRSESPFLLNWLDQNPSDQCLQILVGPEGGWSSRERQLLMNASQPPSFIRVHLGQHILRAETAALFAVSVASARLYLNKI